MKMKKVLALFLLMVVTLTACASEGEKGGSGSEEASADALKIGIIQFARHASLDNCRIGFMEGMEENGYKEGENVIYDYQNADADMALVSQIVDGFVADKVDLVVAIATPAAMGAFNATMDTEIPVIYTAVTDPVQAQLADADGNPTGLATGTSDELPVEAQLKMIREILPEAKTIGILYTTSEANSTAMIKQYEDLVGKYDFELVTEAISQSADIPLAADSILSKVDCLSNLLDNTVVNALPTILDKANSKGIPVFGSEIEQVKLGCLASEGIEYVALGRQTGAMAARLLKGEQTVEEMPFELITQSYLYLNEEVADKLNIELSDQLRGRATEIFTSIEDPNAK